MPAVKVEFSPLAATDLEQIGDYIAQDNPARAISFVNELIDRCLNLGDVPESGMQRDEIAKGIRSTPHERYMIFYRNSDGVVRIERILQGARDYQSGLDDL